MKYVLKTSAPKRLPFDLDADLNPQQKAVVEADPQTMLVLAGAGTGKTRTLTYRVARLVAMGCPPERILLCTFTNRAAREMLQRVQDLVSIDMRRCTSGTFHQVGNRLLRRHGEVIGVSPDFGIVDPEDARTLLASVIAEQGLEKLTAKRFPQPKLMSSFLGLASGTRRPLAEVVGDRAPQMLDQIVVIEEVAQRYAARKRELNVCDFDDLLELWRTMLVRPEAAATAAALRESFDHVLVDEYQDINALQGELCDLMAMSHQSLTCVGDDAQSIYSFRGADFEQIHAFTERHPQARVFELTLNYRSTPEVLNLANRSIAHNARQHPKRLQPRKPSGMTPALIPLRDVYQQAEFVAQRVLELHHEQNLPLRKMAVLYRAHSHSLELQVELTRRGIPYSVRSGTRFFEQAHIKDVVSYLRARENPRDALAWVRLLRLWPGIGAQTAERVGYALAAPDVPPEQRSPTLTILTEQIAEAKGRTQGALQDLRNLWSLLEDAGDSTTELIRLIVEQQYQAYAERTFANAKLRQEDLETLGNYATRFATPQEFLDELALVQGIGAETKVANEKPDDMLVLTTVHQAKGLEWPACFVIGLATGKFPSQQAARSEQATEEERRLFYVGATRAEDELYMTFPTMEESRDGGMRVLRPSPFVMELDRHPPVFDRWEIEEAAPGE